MPGKSVDNVEQLSKKDRERLFKMLKRVIKTVKCVSNNNVIKKNNVLGKRNGREVKKFTG